MFQFAFAFTLFYGIGRQKQTKRKYSHFYRPQTKLREGNAFTRVRLCTERGVLHPFGLQMDLPPAGSMHQKTDGQQAGGMHPTGMHSFKRVHIHIGVKATLFIKLNCCQSVTGDLQRSQKLKQVRGWGQG